MKKVIAAMVSTAMLLPFDLIGGDRVQRRGRLIHQDDFRFHSDRAGDAQTLLLTARKTDRKSNTSELQSR